MQPIFRILRKDLYHYRWAWVFFLFTSLIKILLHGTSLGWISPNLYDAWKPLIETLPWLMGFVLVVLAVQDETLGTPDAYWTSRPVRRLHTLVAKLLFCGIVLCGIYVLSDAVILILNRGAHRLPWLLLSLLTTTAWLWAVILLAAQTRSLARFALVLFGIAIALLFILSITRSAISFGGWRDTWDSVPKMLPKDMSHWSIVLIQSSLWTVAGGFLLILYYQTRRLICWLGLIPVVLCSAILTPNRADDTPVIDTLTQESLSIAKTQNQDGIETCEFSIHITDCNLAADQDLWIKNTRVEVFGQDLYYKTPNKGGIEICNVSNAPTGCPSFTCRLFSTKTTELRELTDRPVNIMVSFDILTGKGSRAVGAIPISGKKTIAHDGHRIGVQIYMLTQLRSKLHVDVWPIFYTKHPILENTEYDRTYQGSIIYHYLGDSYLRNSSSGTNYLYQLRDKSTSALYSVNSGSWIVSGELPIATKPKNIELVISEINDLKEKPFKAIFKDVNLRQIAGLPPAGSSTQ